MTTKHFCYRCDNEIKELRWSVCVVQLGVHSMSEDICSTCKISFPNWIAKMDDKYNERSRKSLYYLVKTLTNNIEELRRHLTKEGVMYEPIQTPQEELVDVPVMRTVPDEGEGSAVQRGEDSS